MNFFKTKSGSHSNSKLLKRIGVAGFLFFLAKGLVWIGVAIWAWVKFG